jgi:hypothetical protein
LNIKSTSGAYHHGSSRTITFWGKKYFERWLAHVANSYNRLAFHTAIGRFGFIPFLAGWSLVAGRGIWPQFDHFTTVQRYNDPSAEDVQYDCQKCDVVTI